MRIGIGTVVVVAGLAVLGGCGDDDTPAVAEADPTAVTCEPGGGGDAEVAITGFTFQRHDTSVDAGQSATFTDQDPTEHSVWSAVRVDGEPAFESELLDEGDASTCTFPGAGTYEYLCGVHNSMTGTITVR